MRQSFRKKLWISLLAVLLPVTASAVELNEAARRAAQQNDAKVLSAKTVRQGNRDMHEIKLLTRKGVVKTVRVPDDSKKNKKKH